MIFIDLIQGVSSLSEDASALVRDLSALERSINALDNGAAFWEMFVPWFSAAVVVGVIAEVWVDVLEHRKDLREYREDMHVWRRGLMSEPSLPSRKLLNWGLVGSVLVTLGVAGELGVGIKIGIINHSLKEDNFAYREKSQQLVALDTKEAGDAKQSAMDAAHDAQRANTEADGAVTKADQAGTASANALSTACKATEVAAALTGRVSTLESARSVDWPTQLSVPVRAPEQLALQEVETYRGTQVFIQPAPGKEPGDLAEKLDGDFLSVGWLPKIMPPPPDIRFFPSGVRIETSSLRAGLRGGGIPSPKITTGIKAATALEKLLKFDLDGVTRDDNLPEAGAGLDMANTYGSPIPLGGVLIEIGTNPDAPQHNAQQNCKPNTKP